MKEKQLADHGDAVARQVETPKILYELDSKVYHGLVSVPDALQAAYQAGSADHRNPDGNDLVIARILREHWLSMIECLHDSNTDKAHCACGAWVSKPQPSVGDAVERWIEHMFRRAGIDIQAKEQLAAPPKKEDTHE